MNRYRQQLPQLDGSLFLTDAGLETDLIFNRGVEVPEFAAHTLLASPAGQHELISYFSGFLALAARHRTGFILDTQTWKAHLHWSHDLGTSAGQLRQINHDAARFAAALRASCEDHSQPIVLNGLVGPKGDAYRPEAQLTVDQADEYHSVQLAWLAETSVDMVTGMTFTNANEAAGFVRAAARLDLPAVISFTVETDGALPSGECLGDAIEAVDSLTDGAAAYFMINCAHPDHFAEALNGDDWLKRIRGVRCNASRCSHAELDNAETLDDGDPSELGALHAKLRQQMPWLNVFGGCCGSDLRHMEKIAKAVLAAQ